MNLIDLTVIVLATTTALAPFEQAFAEKLFKLAENKVPVAIVEVIRNADSTEVHVQTQAPRKDVCWYAVGPNSPYLIAGGHRYRFNDGEHFVGCPSRINYAKGAWHHPLLVMNAGRFIVIDRKGAGNNLEEFAMVKSFYLKAN